MRKKRRVQYVNQSKYRTVPKQKISYRPVVMLVVTLVIFLLVQLLTLSVVGTKGAELAQIEDEKVATEERIRQLKGEISKARSLERIETIATQKLGMQKVEEVVYLDGVDTVSSL